jgi:hypothetical protein
MRNGDHFSTAQTGDGTSPRSGTPEVDEKDFHEGSNAMTPRSSVFSEEISQTSSALGRLMDPIQQINDRKGDLHRVESVFIQKRFMRFSVRSFELRYQAYLENTLRMKVTAPAVVLVAYSVYSLVASDWFNSAKLIENWETASNVLYNLTWISFLLMGLMGIYVGLNKNIFRGHIEIFFQYWAIYVLSVGVLFGNRWRVTHICNDVYASSFASSTDRFVEMDLVMVLVGIIIYLCVYAEMRVRRLIWVVLISYLSYAITALVFGIPIPKSSGSSGNQIQYSLVADRVQAIFLCVGLLLLFLVSMLGKFTLELLQRKNFLELELAEKRIDVLEKTINAMDDDNQPHTQLEQTHKRLKDAERIIEKVRLMGLAKTGSSTNVGDPPEGAQLAFAQELDTALALIRKTERNMTMLDFHKEVLLGPIRTGVEWKQEEVVNWLETVVNPARPILHRGPTAARTSFSGATPAAGRRHTGTPSEMSFNTGVGLRYRSPKRSSTAQTGRGYTDDDLGISAKSLMKQIGSDWTLSLPALVETLHSNQATDLSALRLVARATLVPLAKETLNVSTDVVNSFAKSLDELYLDVPFHNSDHAAQVCHHANTLLDLTGVGRYFSRIDQAALSVAALCHDVSHFGRTNAFLVETNHELAIRYNDSAVLENFHAAMTFQLIKSGASTDITAGLSRREERRFRARVIQLILATDSSTHFQLVGELRMRLLSKTLFDDPQLEDTDRRIVLSSVLRAADLGYHAMPLEEHTVWVERLAEEYAQQGDDERALGLTISPMCDRKSQNIPSMQIGFMNLVVMPLYDELFNLVKTVNPVGLDSFGNVCGLLVANHTHWNLERNQMIAAQGGINMEELAEEDERINRTDGGMSDGSELYIPAPTGRNSEGFPRAFSGASPNSPFPDAMSPHSHNNDLIQHAYTEELLRTRSASASVQGAEVRMVEETSEGSVVSLTYSQAHGYTNDENDEP